MPESLKRDLTRYLFSSRDLYEAGRRKIRILAIVKSLYLEFRDVDQRDLFKSI